MKRAFRPMPFVLPCVLILAAACAGSDGSPPAPLQPHPDGMSPASVGSNSPSNLDPNASAASPANSVPSHALPGVASGSAEVMFAPDMRPPVSSAKPPPAISGGTLLLARDGVTAIAADPDRDRVSIVDMSAQRVRHQVALNAGDEPGRAVEDGAGRVHVVLRGAGEVATIDIAAGNVAERTAVCAAPRGIAFDASTDALYVACLTGEVMSLPASGGAVTRSVYVASDLRDVIVHDGRVQVTQFRSARLLDLDADLAVAAEHRPVDVTETLALGSEAFLVGPQVHDFAPAIARRTIALSDGRTLMLHQRAMIDTVDVKGPDDELEPVESDDPLEPSFPEGAAPGGYGSGDSCQSIVQTAVSVVDAEGNILHSKAISGSVLPVDVAVSPDGTIAVANGGVRDPDAPGRVQISGEFGGPGFESGFFGIGVGISMIDGDSSLTDNPELGEPCAFGNVAQPEGQPTALAFTVDGTLVVQSREPAKLILISPDATREIALGGESFADTGHDLFHRDSGGGIACASCHAEGADDGHVWDFKGFGLRRTQSINVGLRDTAPFHWSGDMPDLTALMGEVFVNRMGGVPQIPTRIESLANWMFAQKPFPAQRASDEPAVLHGKELFENEQVACGKCHSGEKLTNNKSEDVGTGGKFQVPSLRGLVYRAPFIHTGCAATLRDRFEPGCGGEKHGDVSHLSVSELDDLIAYLESL
jgi:DNA-binding beta-propeller fold protein YncE/mono/diheme cytochrome c family protein